MAHAVGITIETVMDAVATISAHAEAVAAAAAAEMRVGIEIGMPLPAIREETGTRPAKRVGIVVVETAVAVDTTVITDAISSKDEISNSVQVGSNEVVRATRRPVLRPTLKAVVLKAAVHNRINAITSTVTRPSPCKRRQ
jgi:hypothetical protein